MEDVLYTVTETAKILKTNPQYIYNLINKGLLPALKLGRFKIRRTTIEKFVEQYEGKDLSDLDNIKDLEVDNEKLNN